MLYPKMMSLKHVNDNQFTAMKRGNKIMTLLGPIPEQRNEQNFLSSIVQLVLDSIFVENFGKTDSGSVLIIFYDWSMKVLYQKYIWFLQLIHQHLSYFLSTYLMHFS